MRGDFTGRSGNTLCVRACAARRLCPAGDAFEQCPAPVRPTADGENEEGPRKPRGPSSFSESEDSRNYQMVEGGSTQITSNTTPGPDGDAPPPAMLMIASEPFHEATSAWTAPWSIAEERRMTWNS